MAKKLQPAHPHGAVNLYPVITEGEGWETIINSPAMPHQDLDADPLYRSGEYVQGLKLPCADQAEEPSTWSEKTKNFPSDLGHYWSGNLGHPPFEISLFTNLSVEFYQSLPAYQ